jgi:hypothetical protein
VIGRDILLFRASLGDKNRRGLEGLNSPPYRILNKERILAPLIPSDIWTLKLALKVIKEGNWRGSSIQSCKGEDLIHSNPL